MKQRKHLNIKGKIAVALLVLSMTILLVGLINQKDDHRNASVPVTSAQSLTLSFESVESFSDSPLNKSLVEKKKEIARQK